MIELDIEVTFNKRVASDIFLMGLRSAQIVSDSMPGQFVMIRVSDATDPLLRRPFSICGVPGGDLFLILYRVVGRGTAIMSGAREGDRLSVLGPLGRGFDLSKTIGRSLLVGGGIGVAPLMFLAQTIEGRDVTFMTGYSSASEEVPMEQVCAKGTEILIATDDGSIGHKGPVTDLLESYLEGGAHGDLKVFACGPLPMLRRVAAMTLGHDVSCQVSMETAMACGLGVCQGCALKSSPGQEKTYFFVCQDGPVFQAQSLDWKEL